LASGYREECCRVNVTFMVLFMGAVILIVGHCDDVSVVYLFF